MRPRSLLQAVLPLCALLFACDEASAPGVDQDGASDGATPEPDAAQQRDDAALDDAALDAATADAATLDAARDAMIAVPCTAVAPTACPTPAPTYARVAPIIERRCAGCHSPNWTGPWPLDTYGHVADWQDTIRTMLLDCSMPPADAGGPLPDEESAVILGFIRCGLPM